MTDERIQEITNAVGRELGMAITVEQGRLVKRVLDAELRKEPQTFTREELGKILAEVDEYSFPTSDSPEVGDVWEKLGGKVPAAGTFTREELADTIDLIFGHRLPSTVNIQPLVNALWQALGGKVPDDGEYSKQDTYDEGCADCTPTWTPWHEGDEVPELVEYQSFQFGWWVNGSWGTTDLHANTDHIKHFADRLLYYRIVDNTPPAPPEPETPKTDNEDELVMFLGWLSTQEKAVVIGAQWETPYVMKYVDEWRKLRAARQIGRTT